MTALKNRRKREARLPLWHRVQAEKREVIKKVFWKRGFFWIALGIFIVSCWYVYKALTGGIWQDQENLNIVVGSEGKSLAVISVSEKDSVLVMYLDPQVMVDSVYGYGEYKVGSLLKLGSLEKLGSKLLTRTLQHQLGLKIHDYVSIEVPSSNEIDVAFLKKLIRPMAFSLIGKPLGVTDLVKYVKTISILRPDQIEVIPIHESRLSYTQSLPDESLVYKLDEERLDAFLQTHMRELVFSNTTTSVAIVNTTTYSGLASSLARILLNSGIDVVSLGENQEHLEKSIIMTSIGGKESQIVMFLASLFPFEVKEASIDEYRAEVVILLGEDFNKLFSQRP